MNSTHHCGGHLIVLHGPTASGKTALAIDLAHKLGCEIASFDSRQFYREMRIGTATPTPSELAQVPHHFIHDRSIHTPLSAGSYQNEALQLLDTLFAKSPHAIMVGGSGLYATAVTTGLDELPHDEQIRIELNSLEMGELQAKLKALDPDFYEIVALDNRRRVQRAVEVCLATGRPYSAQRSNTARKRPFRITEIAIDRPRETLYDRINQRVDSMLMEGLIQEAQSLIPHKHLQPLQTVGYRELFDYFDGSQPSLDEAIRLIKQNTRHYAKRQLTWLRSKPQITHLTPQAIADLNFF